MLSVTKAVEAGKMMELNKTSCQILYTNEKLITVARRVRNLYYLNCLNEHQQANAADNQSQQSKEDVWHWCYGHLGEQNQQNLAKEELVDGIVFNSLQTINFWDPCIEGKQHRRKFPNSRSRR